jgi:hypothetical protein
LLLARPAVAALLFCVRRAAVLVAPFAVPGLPRAGDLRARLAEVLVFARVGPLLLGVFERFGMLLLPSDEQPESAPQVPRGLTPSAPRR